MSATEPVTRFCPDCAGEFVAAVEWCPDCELPLQASPPPGEHELGPDWDEVVAFDIDEWEPELRVALDRALEAAAIPRLWEGADLVVRPGDADRAAELLDEVVHPDALPVEDDEGPGGATAAELLADAFVAADRLAGDPADVTSRAELSTAGQDIGGVGVPYGFGARDWEELVEHVEATAARFESGGEADELRAAARELRDRLWPLV